MADIVNNPGNGTNNSTGWIIAVVLILFLLLIAFFVFGDNDDDARDTVQDRPAQVEERTNTDPTPAPTINNTFNSTTTINTATTTDQ